MAGFWFKTSLYPTRSLTKAKAWRSNTCMVPSSGISFLFRATTCMSNQHSTSRDGLVSVEDIIKAHYTDTYKNPMAVSTKHAYTQKIAIIGMRGIPNSYGGFETLAEEIAGRLVKFGSEVVVYCRRNYFVDRPIMYKGIRLAYLPTIENKFLDTPFHSLISVAHTVLKSTANTIIIVNIGNAPFAFLAKLLGKKVIFCVDGLDWQRKKWNAFARFYLKTCSRFAKYAAHEVITDAQSVQDFYKSARKTNSTHIPYGTEIETDYTPEIDVLKEYNLEYKKYFTFVARFEPENNPLLVVKAYVESGSTFPLVMIGDNRYNQAFVEEIKAAANDRVIFLGYVFGARYKHLVKNSLAYVRAAEVGGLSPAVIEAMGRGACVVANDKPENREALADIGLFYSLTTNDLVGHFKYLTAHPERGIELGKKAAQRAMVLYSWDRIAYEYFKLVKKVSEPSVVQVESSPVTQTGTKRMLITGAGGMLGSALYNFYKEKYIVLATSLHATESWLTALNVCNEQAYEQVVAHFKPDYIVHAPALTNLEYCETHLPEAYAVNTLSVKYAAELATKYNAKLIYISSTNVFDGSKKAYADNDEPHPINVYGLTKQMGALMAEYYARDYLTIRLGWLMGGGPKKDKKFVAKIVEQLLAGKQELNALNDHTGSISYAHDVALNLELLLRRNASGTYNMVSNGMPTRFEVAKEIVRLLGYDNQVKVTAVDQSFFAQTFTTVRSSHECLLNQRLDHEEVNLQRSWKDALEAYLKSDFAYARAVRTGADGFASEPVTL